MKKKSASRSAFLNLRVLIALFVVLAGVFVALIGLGTFSGLTASSAQAQQKHKIINIQGLPPGFDCATIYEKGIKVSNAEMKTLDIQGDAFHPEWNYTIRPRSAVNRSS